LPPAGAGLFSTSSSDADDFTGSPVPTVFTHSMPSSSYSPCSSLQAESSDAARERGAMSSRNTSPSMMESSDTCLDQWPKCMGGIAVLAVDIGELQLCPLECGIA